MARKDDYSHGHAPSVVAHHARRTAADSAAFLVPHLQPGMRMLDVGCGPGSITVELAAMVHPGRVLAIDVAPAAIEATESAVAAAGLDNVEVTECSVYELGEERFDIIYAHQVLQHLTDPVAALRSMARVLTEHGMVAVRDSDYAGMIWAPRPAGLDRWVALYHGINDALGLQADSGRWLPTWVAEAGFTQVAVTTSTWTHATPEARAVWGGAWQRRVLDSSYAEHALDLGLSTVGELEEISAAFEWWAAQPNAMWMVPHVEVIARR